MYINRKTAILIFLIGLFSALISEIVALVIVSFNDGIGSGDLYSFGLWNLLYAVYLTFAGLTSLAWVSGRSKIANSIILLFFGFYHPVIWTIIVFQILGNSFYNFSFPVFYLWVASGFLYCILIFIFVRLQNFKINPALLKMNFGRVLLFILGIPIVMFFVTYLIMLLFFIINARFGIISGQVNHVA